MRHLTEDELILAYYGEADPDPAHVRGCALCRAEYTRLASLLDRLTEEAAPAVPPGLAARVSAHLGLDTAAPRRRLRWLVPAAVAAMLVVTFQLGRRMPVETPQRAAREPVPVLRAALPDHFERAHRVLAEIANAPRVHGIDISAERSLARDLVESNRLLRAAAARQGEARIESLLDDLERVLIEIAHSPDTMSAAERAWLRRRLETLSLLFRFHIVEEGLAAPVPRKESAL